MMAAYAQMSHLKLPSLSFSLEKVTRCPQNCSLLVVAVEKDAVEVDDDNLNGLQVKHDVIWFQVPVDVAHLMKLGDTLTNLN